MYIRKEDSLSPNVDRVKDDGSSMMTMCEAHQADNSFIKKQANDKARKAPRQRVSHHEE